MHGPRRPFHHPAQLSDAEREQVLAVLDAPRFADKSPGQVWAVLLDEGVYLCSQTTMYRLLRERGQSGERRAQAMRPATTKPELEADGPNQVWSWDITKLKGPVRGVYYSTGPPPKASPGVPRPMPGGCAPLHKVGHWRGACWAGPFPVPPFRTGRTRFRVSGSLVTIPWVSRLVAGRGCARGRRSRPRGSCVVSWP